MVGAAVFSSVRQALRHFHIELFALTYVVIATSDVRLWFCFHASPLERCCAVFYRTDRCGSPVFNQLGKYVPSPPGSFVPATGIWTSLWAPILATRRPVVVDMLVFVLIHQYVDLRNHYYIRRMHGCVQYGMTSCEIWELLPLKRKSGFINECQ